MSERFYNEMYSASEWRQFAQNFRNLDISDAIQEFNKELVENVDGCYVALRFNPRDGEFHTSASPSEECSTDEYFGENGPASRCTLTSGKAWRPGPEDGYEWSYVPDGSFWGNSNGDYFDHRNLDSKAERMEGYDELPDGSDLEEFVTGLGYSRFNVSSTPVDYEEDSHLFDDIAKQIENGAEACEQIAEELESAKETA